MEGKTLLYIYFSLMLILIIAILIGSSIRDNLRKNKQDILIERPVVHLGGYPFLNSNDGIYLQIRKDSTVHLYKDTTKESTRKDYKIKIDQITKYEIKSEDQIQKDITLGRFMIFGIASLALQKKSKVVNEYLILTYKENDVEIECLFKGIIIGNDRLGDIVSVLNRLKIESKQ